MFRQSAPQYPYVVTIERKLAVRLRGLRKKKGLTQEDISERAGVDYKFYQSLEGKNPPSATLRTLEKLAKALAMPVWKILRFDKTR